MGSTSWSDRDYTDRSATRAATGATAFTYDASVKASGTLVVHPDMDIKGKRRESRDSTAHPNSKGIAVVFDVTGSMGGIPVVLQKKLGQLMRVLLAKSYMPDPQILFGAIGDANCDSVPLQIGQFESGLEMDDDLGKLVLEGRGGGQIKESYELLPYFFATRVDMDCFEKRGEKGYLFTIGDEYPYPRINKDQVESLMGVSLEADVKLEDAVKMVLEKFEWFHIIPRTSTGAMPEVQQHWKDLLGERVLFLDDPNAVCETIVLTIGLIEGAITDTKTGADDLHAAGSDRGAIASATTALAVLTNSRAITPKVAASNLPAASASTAGSDGRL
jgi:hypothetical protein